MELAINAASQESGGNSPYIKEVSMQSFMADVVQASLKVPVLLYFTASWCGPCKQLGPTLHKLVDQAAGKLILARVDIDKNQQIAAQFGVQSVPSVFVFSQGQPVDAFQGALPEGQVKEFLSKLGIEFGGDENEDVLAAAEECLQAGDADEALVLFKQVNAKQPENPKAIAGVIKAYTMQMNFDEAEALLKALPDVMLGQEDVATAATALRLTKTATLGASKVAEFEAALAKNPNDHQARLDLSVQQFAVGSHEEAMESLLYIISKDRAWNEEAARKQLVDFFEVLGHTHPLTLQYRRRLSTLLFS